MKLSFEIEEFLFGEEDIPALAFRLRKKKKAKKLKVEGDKSPFIKNLEDQYENKAFEKGSGIDFYLDAGRYLPNSINISKVIIKIVDSSLNEAMKS